MSSLTRTLRGWIDNAGDRLDLMWTEPLSGLIVLAGLVGAIRLRREAGRSHALRVAALAGATIWLVAACAVTIYPIDGEFEAPTWGRVEVQSFIPLAGTIEGLANSGGRTLSDEEYEAERLRIAAELDIPADEVTLSRHWRGPGVAAVLKDPIGNVVLFLPLGLLVPIVWRRARTTAGAALFGATVSTAIEASQMLFGLGSLGTIDDVLFNTLGAVAGFGLYRAADATRRAMGHSAE